MVADDEPGILLLVRRALEAEGYGVEAVGSGREAHRQLMEQDFDLAVLDIEMPGRSGLEVLDAVREAGRQVMILMLTQRQREPDVVAGLEAGADDYLGKPFSMAELSARVRALLRRRGQAAGEELRFGPIRMDRAQRRVTAGDAPVDLTPREYQLLEYLLRRPRRVVPRDAGT